jgi:hypothetical protein
MLITWHWAPEKAKEVTARFKEWEPSGKYKMLYPISTIIGSNKGFGVAEVDNIVDLHNDLTQWTDLITYKCSPCMDSREVVPLSK